MEWDYHGVISTNTNAHCTEDNSEMCCRKIQIRKMIVTLMIRLNCLATCSEVVLFGRLSHAHLSQHFTVNIITDVSNILYFHFFVQLLMKMIEPT